MFKTRANALFRESWAPCHGVVMASGGSTVVSKRILVADRSVLDAGTALNYMMPKEDVQPPGPAPSHKNEGTQPQVAPEEDPDKIRIRGEVFKRMFPDLRKKSPE